MCDDSLTQDLLEHHHSGRSLSYHVAPAAPVVDFMRMKKQQEASDKTVLTV